MRGVCDRLRKGAEMGCKGEGWWAAEGKNNPMAYIHGKRMAYSLQYYIKDGYLYGPLRKEELPWALVKTSPLTMGLFS